MAIQSVSFQRRSVARQVADQLAKRIRQGEWLVGSQLPSTRELVEQLGVSLNSAHAGVQMLAEQGLVESRPRRGVFVRPEAIQSVADDEGTRDQIALVRFFTREDAEGEDKLQEHTSWWQTITYAAETKWARDEGWHTITLPVVKDNPEANIAFLLEQVESLKGRLAGVLLSGGPGVRRLLPGLDELDLPWLTLNAPSPNSLYNFVSADNMAGGLRVQVIDNLSKTIFLTDSLDRTHFLNTGKKRGEYLVTPSQSNGYFCDPRHTGAVNVLWADMHASAVKVTDKANPWSSGLTSDYNHPNYWDRK